MSQHLIQCNVCGAQVKDYLGDHLLEAHGLTVQGYLGQHPGAPTASERIWKRYKDSVSNTRRQQPVTPAALAVNLAGLQFPVNIDVPEGHCLPLPAHYGLPRFGTLGEDIQNALISLKMRRSIYIWGLPGSGKDALFHAWSALTRTPAIIKQVRPGADIESWFFSRGFNQQGTYWEEGEVLKALRDGYTTPAGRKIPYLVLVSDFDRADSQQAEHLRLVIDSIQGRVEGPAGAVYPVFPGTMVAATGNTCGGGDDRGRMISANPMDASLLERFDVGFQFHWMDWRDEEPVVKAKFPVLSQRYPGLFPKMGDVCKNLREAILKDDLHAEFSHRALCSILRHAEDLVLCNTSGKVPKNFMKIAARAWLDRLPDEANRQKARNIMDPTFNTMDEGDISHIGGQDVAAGLKRR